MLEFTRRTRTGVTPDHEPTHHVAADTVAAGTASTMSSRRSFLARIVGLVALGMVQWRSQLLALGGETDPVLTIYKSKTCGCCGKWVEHLTASRLRSVVHDREDMDDVKDWLGVPRGVRSCHTAQVEGYLIEGHVPASDIRVLLTKRPKVAGLAVPDMPTGTPGMATPGKPAEPYAVLAFQRDGTTKLFARH